MKLEAGTENSCLFFIYFYSSMFLITADFAPDTKPLKKTGLLLPEDKWFSSHISS